ncbi:E3 ubiquitin-protein ligase At1g63170-like [Chenopodium quinoa]|uniref:E3 ubiquitin-protein ligase At1g63170-like n=1 Tax=Chenopodium quinoa TaxID=63459 RepID=UPI000B78BDA0|nr:E3 ubiquitin-protein ligase At1g63170-like [Chenopodium quinoa]
MSATDVDTTAPLLAPLSPPSGNRSLQSRSRRISSRAGLRGAARFLRRANSRRMISEQSVMVRESAAQQIEERQSDWAYSTPIVVLDLLWNTIFVFVAIAIMILSGDEKTQVPLRLWLVGYGFQCILHMVCVCVEYKRRREISRPWFGSSGGWNVGVGPSSGSSLALNLNSGSNRSSNVNSGHSRSNSSSSASLEGDSMEFYDEHQQDEDNTSVAKHLESANTMFSFIWWIIGFYWVSSGGPSLADDAPKLYWLTITFLAFDVFFVVICVVVACIIGIAVCCCLPCIIAILYALADQEGATNEDIDRLPKFKFRRLGQIEKKSGEIQESLGGIMTQCGTDPLIEHALSEEDAECVICLTSYEDGSELRELPCRHHFHCTCIDKWLHINATCPLCKYNILKNGCQSSEEV